MARGFEQVEGVDCFDVFAPVAQSVTFRVLISIAAQRQLDVQQLHVCTAFLNRELDEDIYVKLPDNIPQDSIPSSTRIWKLQKAVYGLKQAARAWNDKLCAELTALGFRQSITDPCLFLRAEGEETILFLVHVDDARIVGSSADAADVKKDVAEGFRYRRHRCCKELPQHTDRVHGRWYHAFTREILSSFAEAV